MIRLLVDPTNPEASKIDAAAEVIRRGGLVAFPTETVYGLGADALDEAAVLGIFAAKGRPTFNPLIAHIADLGAISKLALSWPNNAALLARNFWPGPLTIVLPKRPEVPDALTAGRDSVAIRMPAHPVALALIRAAGSPIAAPSANRFTEVSPTTADHVAHGLGDRVDVILDGGSTDVGIESTVIDLSGPHPVLLRPGTLDRDAIERVLGVALEDPAPVDAADAPRLAPGMIDRHYAPHARVELVDASQVEAQFASSAAEGRVGAIVRTAAISGADVLSLPVDPLGYARALYAALHALDDRGCTVIVIEMPPSDRAWDGVNDRLRRAAHPA